MEFTVPLGPLKNCPQLVTEITNCRISLGPVCWLKIELDTTQGAASAIREFEIWRLRTTTTRASDISRKKIKVSRDFQGQIRGKIGRFRGSLAEKIQISKDFQGQILRKIDRFHGKFRGGNFAKKQSVKNSRFRWILFWQISLKSTQFSRRYDQRCLTFF